MRIGFNLGFFDTSMAYYSELGKEFLHTQKNVLKKVSFQEGFKANLIKQKYVLI